jgi:hypothetical protein
MINLWRRCAATGGTRRLGQNSLAVMVFSSVFSFQKGGERGLGSSVGVCICQSTPAARGGLLLRGRR